MGRHEVYTSSSVGQSGTTWGQPGWWSRGKVRAERFANGVAEPVLIMADLTELVHRRNIRKTRELVRDAGLTIWLQWRRRRIGPGGTYRRGCYVIRQSDAERVRRALAYADLRRLAGPKLRDRLPDDGRDDWLWLEARRGRMRKPGGSWRLGHPAGG